MKKPLPDRPSLLALTLARGSGGRFIADNTHRVDVAGLAASSSLGAAAETLHGRSVLIATQKQLPAALAALALEGVAARILLCPPDLPSRHLSSIVGDAGVNGVVADDAEPLVPGLANVVARSDLQAPFAPPPVRDIATEWVLFTSGTTGRPKLVRHTLDSLIGPLADGLAVPDRAVWSTFYDVRRYGGLQILLRALLGGASMVLSSAAEPVGAFLQRAGREGVTHISGTPSHWRRALMSPDASAMHPGYVRLSGEVADQGILDQLRAAYPGASVAHAYASTEAGVAFDVRDGLAGFPASALTGGAAEMRVEDGTLRIRSGRTASGYLGADFAAPGGFVDTGDMVERRGDRYYFVGRREGVINVGGQKVYPEEVEAVINAHPAVRMCRVWARHSPITGAVVAAEIVLADDHADFDTVRDQVLAACRAALPGFKVPATLRRAAAIAIAESGKLVRHDA